MWETWSIFQMTDQSTFDVSNNNCEGRRIHPRNLSDTQFREIPEYRRNRRGGKTANSLALRRQSRATCKYWILRWQDRVLKLGSRRSQGGPLLASIRTSIFSVICRNNIAGQFVMVLRRPVTANVSRTSDSLPRDSHKNVRRRDYNNLRR